MIPYNDIARANPVFVIAQQGKPDLVTTTFEVGADGRNEGIAVFTSRANAQKYIDDAGWTDGETVAELQPVDFARWLFGLPADGPDLLIVNPNRDEQDAGIQQAVSAIEGLVADVAGALIQNLRSPLGGEARDSDSSDAGYDIFTCPLCGHARRQAADARVPECCGTPMTLAARDAQADTATVPSAAMQ